VASRGADHRSVGLVIERLAAVAVVAVSVTACRTPTSDLQKDGVFLAQAWDAYKTLYIRADGYVLDPSRESGEVTSEGQGYALLRAAWMRDEPTFTRVFAWTEQHLRRPDGLHSWRWTPDGGGRLLDRNTATDADQEIAFALVLAAVSFDKPELLVEARDLLRSIRRHAAVVSDAGWFPAAGNWGVSERIVNLSYFLPYAYPYFARIDHEGQWDRVVDTGYNLLASVLGLPEVRLIPDFMVVTSGGDAALLPDNVRLSRDFSSDAMRIYWRVAVDCRMHRRVRACADPVGVGHLRRLLTRDGVLYTRYAVDGWPLERVESISFYGTALPFLGLHAPEAALAIQAKQLSPEAQASLLTDPKRYYDANWVWFGLAAAGDFLAERTPPVEAIEPPGP